MDLDHDTALGVMLESSRLGYEFNQSQGYEEELDDLRSMNLQALKSKQEHANKVFNVTHFIKFTNSFDGRKMRKILAW
jgi:hypothetical protein